MELFMAEQDQDRQQVVSLWYCVRSKPKHEQIAARHLRLIPEVKVFCPQIRYRKATARGPVWFTEAVFPGYIFAKLDLAENFRRVCGTPGVGGIVHFGDCFSVLSDSLIENLRQHMDGGEMKCFAAPVNVGDHARIIEGPCVGLDVVVTRFVPARERVRVLMNVLGRETETEVKLSALAIKPGNPLAA